MYVCISVHICTNVLMYKHTLVQMFECTNVQKRIKCIHVQNNQLKRVPPCRANFLSIRPRIKFLFSKMLEIEN